MKIVYTLSDKRNMPKEILKSLKDIIRFVDYKDILVFYTSPSSKFIGDKISKYATLIKTDNITKPFISDEGTGLSGYGEKIHLCDVKDKDVIFLDCDTRIKKDITKLLNDVYDFSARIISFDCDKKIWKKYCKSFNMFSSPPIFNTGFMIFRYGLHSKIKDLWIKHLKCDIPKIHKHCYVKEEYALALALPENINIKFMNEETHFFNWYDKNINILPYIIHGYKRTFKRRLKNKIKKTIKNSIFFRGQI